MGIAESKILANKILFACDRAEREGKDKLDQSQFWKNAVSRESLGNLLEK